MESGARRNVPIHDPHQPPAPSRTLLLDHNLRSAAASVLDGLHLSWYLDYVMCSAQCHILVTTSRDSPWSIRSPQCVLWGAVACMYLVCGPTVAEAWSQHPTFHDPSAQHNGLSSVTEVWMCNDAALRRIPQQPFLYTFRRCNKAVSLNHHHFQTYILLKAGISTKKRKQDTR